MQWSPQRIRGLRLKFGWSAAEFGRRLGVTLQDVVLMESGLHQPGGRILGQLGYFESLVEECSKRLRCSALADHIMVERGITQVTADEVRMHQLD